jgi:hypothetical protein
MIIDGLLKLRRIYVVRFNVSAALSIKVTVFLGVALCTIDWRRNTVLRPKISQSLFLLRFFFNIA